LIHNALKFTNKGEVVIFVRAKATHIEAGVQDTGVGIPKDKLHTVFQKFEILQDTRNRVDKPVPGTGLGLNISQKLAHQHGGRIFVDATHPRTRLVLELPRRQFKPG
jgi:signal transduction histidine kinase